MNSTSRIILIVFSLFLMQGDGSAAELSGDSSSDQYLSVEMAEQRLTEAAELIKKRSLTGVVELLTPLTFNTKTLNSAAKLISEALYAQGKKEEVFDRLTGWIEENPDNYQLVALRGHYLFLSYYLISAREDLEKAYQHGVRSAQMVHHLGQFAWNDQNFSEANRLFREGTKLDPDDDQIWFRSSLAEFRTRHFEKALSAIQQALRLSPSDARYQKQHLGVLKTMKNWKGFSEAAATYIEKTDDPVGISSIYADVMQNLNQQEEALGFLDGAIDNYPDAAPLYLLKARLFIRMNRLDDAAEFYREGLKKNPENEFARAQRANLLWYLKRFEESVSELNKLQDNGFREVFIYHQLASWYLQKDQTWQAEKAIINGLQIKPDDIKLLSMYAQILEKRANLEDAVLGYQAILQINPEDALAQAKIGNLYRLQGQLKKAEYHLNKSIKIDRNQLWVRVYYIELLTQQGEWKKALEQLNFLLSSGGESEWALSQKALIETRLERYRSALGAINKAIVLNPRSSVLKEIEGDILVNLDQYQLAEASYKEAIQASEGNSDLKIKLAYVKFYQKDPAADEVLFEALKNDEPDLKTDALWLDFQKLTTNVWGWKKGSCLEKSYEWLLRNKTGKFEAELKKCKTGKEESLKPFLKYLSAAFQSEAQSSGLPEPLSWSPWSYYLKGYQSFNQKLFKQSVHYFKQAYRLMPDNQWVGVRLGQAYEENGNPEAAAIEYERFLKKMPGNLWAQLRLALVYDLSNQPFKSESLYKKILQRFPEEQVALNNLAWLYLTAKNPDIRSIDKAIELSQQAVRLRANAANLDTLAEAYFQKGNYKQALILIEKALDRDRKNLDYFKKQRKKIQKALRQKQ